MRPLPDTSSVIALLSQYFLALVFATSGSSKLRSKTAFVTFSTSVQAILDWSNGRIARVIAGVVTTFELILAILLFSGYERRFVLATAITVLVAFTALLLRTLWRRQAVSCNCFGPSQAVLGPIDIARNLIFLTVGLVALISPYLPAPSTITLFDRLTAVVLCAIVLAGILAAVTIGHIVQKRPLPIPSTS